MFIVVVIAFSYAFYVWKGDNTSVTFNISDNYFYCEECGGRFYYDETDVVYMSDGTQLCQSCFDKVGAYCERCGEPQFEQDLIYDGETGLGYCHYCWNMDKGVE